MNKYFKTDGYRFIYHDDVLLIVKKIALALSCFPHKRIIIGSDTRFSSPIIVKTIINNIDIDKIDYVGVISTPGICYLSSKYKCLGIMVTASHNSYVYNGIKIVINGQKLTQKQITLLEKNIDLIKEEEIKDNIISIEENKSLKEEYFTFIRNFIKPISTSCCFDFAHGSLSNYGHELLTLLNKDNIYINNNPDGYNINLDCGATSVNGLQSYLKVNNIKYGIAFDGDADRLILVDQDNIYNGDAIIYILANYFIIKKNKVVITKYSSLGLIKSLKNKGIKCLISDVGDNNVYAMMKKHHLTIGGETSGHIIIRDYLMTGDGLLNAIILLRIIDKTSLNLLLKGYKPYPSCLISLSIKNHSIINNPILTEKIKNYNSLYKHYINIFIRLSGTENKLRIYICYLDQKVIDNIKSSLISIIQVLDHDIKYDNIEDIFIDEHSSLGDNIEIYGGCHIKNSSLKNNIIINDSFITDSHIESNVTIGPFAQIRNKSFIGENCRIGDFVEIKNSSIGNNTKIAHLTYIGDTTCGENVNFGCGVITVNYDGKNKHKTIIGSNCFIGSNVNLIAPITIGDKVLIAAGSTVTKDVNSTDLVIARSRELTKEHKALDYPYFAEDKKCVE